MKQQRIILTINVVFDKTKTLSQKNDLVNVI